jgi:hypothetical protein
MMKDRTFRIVWVSPGHGAGIPNEERHDTIIQYAGKAVIISAAMK